MLNRVSFVLYFKSNATNKEIGKAVQRLAGKRGVAGHWPLANQHGGTSYEFQVSDDWAESFQDAVRAEKVVREFGRSDRQEN